MKKITALSLVLALGGCQESLVRSDFISPNVGDSVAVNASNQTIDPWPIYVNDTNIQTSAERQKAAIKKYNTGPVSQAAVIPTIATIAPADPVGQ